MLKFTVEIRVMANKPEDEEMKNMGLYDLTINVEYEINDKVQVINGPFEGFEGTVNDINKEKRKVKVTVTMFGRENSTEISYDQLRKLN